MKEREKFYAVFGSLEMEQPLAYFVNGGDATDYAEKISVDYSSHAVVIPFFSKMGLWRQIFAKGWIKFWEEQDKEREENGKN